MLHSFLSNIYGLGHFIVSHILDIQRAYRFGISGNVPTIFAMIRYVYTPIPINVDNGRSEMDMMI